MDKSYWNNAAKTVRTSHPERQALNDLIGLELAKVRRAYIDHRLKGKEVNFSTIKNLFTVETQCTELLQLVETYNRESEISITRQRHIKTAYRHAIASGMPSIVEKIKSEHIKNLKKHLYKTLMKNTVLSVMKRLKSVFNFAVNNGVIEKPPMDGIVIGEFESKYGFLTEGDITRIATTLPDLSPDLIKVGKMFLFCCYTGLRFGDAINLKNCTVLETSHGRAIYFEAKKTRKKQYIPLMPEADQLFNDVKKLKVTNQYYNRCLKEIGSAAKVSAVLSSHLARHTFATIGINKGIKLEVMQSLLGHSDIKTPQGYAELFDTTKREELSKWNK